MMSERLHGSEAQAQDREFERALREFPEGYSEGHFHGRRWGTTVRRSQDQRRVWLYAEDLSATDIISFNLYMLAAGERSLKPCEMSSSKVMEFVVNFEPEREKPLSAPAHRAGNLLPGYR